MNKKNRNALPRLIATIALLGIVLSFVGTGIIMLFGAGGSHGSSSYNPTTNEISQEELDAMIQQLELQEGEIQVLQGEEGTPEITQDSQ